MPYEFKCISCSGIIYTEFIKEKKTVYKCPHCDWSKAMDGKHTKEFFNFEEITDKDDLESSNFEEIADENDSGRKTTIKKLEMENDIDNDIKEYPALKFLSGVANFIAWSGVITGIIGGFIYLGTLTKNSQIEITIIALVTLTLTTFILFVFWRAISEILILFVDMAQDTRKIRLNQTNNK
jgi:hypothetical protein